MSDPTDLLLSYKPPPEIEVNFRELIDSLSDREQLLNDAYPDEDDVAISVRRLLSDIPELNGEDLAQLLLVVPARAISKHPAKFLMDLVPAALKLAYDQAMNTCFIIGVELGREMERRSHAK